MSTSHDELTCDCLWAEGQADDHLWAERLRCHWAETTELNNFIFSYMPWQLLKFIVWMDSCSLSLCCVSNSRYLIFHLVWLVRIMITYGVYSPIYFITRKALFYIFVCGLIIPSLIHYMSAFICI